ncbi:hypothetical protein T06_9442 [Trichinella sp. T6]|nr:hypothetical protein T06_9442 [Trichinella sp. T6]
MILLNHRSHVAKTLEPLVREGSWRFRLRSRLLVVPRGSFGLDLGRDRRCSSEGGSSRARARLALQLTTLRGRPDG